MSEERNNQEMSYQETNDQAQFNGAQDPQQQQAQYNYGGADFSQPVQEQKGQSIASLVLGLVGLIAWCIPLFGYPVTIIGIIMGVMGMKKGGRGMAIAGIILSVICLIITIINSVAGAMMAVQTLPL